MLLWDTSRVPVDGAAIESDVRASAAEIRRRDGTHIYGSYYGCYSTDQPDLAPSDFHLFGPLKQHLRGKHLADGDDIQHEVLLWMRQQPKEFYAAGIGALIKGWD
ncbi:hypothetical protein AVEN_164619-1 [Araneus ventricosus]|uniref:Uncharacterized protein n=1 Tax=Araneus ventricosus TaxID=182803 RepID=A0A4Y2P3H9_ARAVE|nr:hypothetical protein AVEN_164619-1 [Araneus ventricosus]